MAYLIINLATGMIMIFIKTSVWEGWCQEVDALLAGARFEKEAAVKAACAVETGNGLRLCSLFGGKLQAFVTKIISACVVISLFINKGELLSRYHEGPLRESFSSCDRK